MFSLRRFARPASAGTTATGSHDAPSRTSGLRRLVKLAVVGAVGVGLVAGFVAPAAANTPVQIAGILVHEINLERAANHLPALANSYRLNNSAGYHNMQMAHNNIMTHQLVGEPNLGTRISRTTFPWTYCAENIAWTSAISTGGAIGVHRSMYGEVAPNNGHRLNILSRNVNWVGISVIIDNTHHKLWITEDFAHFM